VIANSAVIACSVELLNIAQLVIGGFRCELQPSMVLLPRLTAEMHRKCSPLMNDGPILVR
jgi:hypothetical protein